MSVRKWNDPFRAFKRLEKNIEEGRKIAAAGHQIGNHTYSHDRMILKTPSFIKREIESTNHVIRETGYEGPIDFRPPYGKKLIGLPFYLKANNIQSKRLCGILSRIPTIALYKIKWTM